MTDRRSIHTKEFAHSQPIPAASRIGNMLFSGLITGLDPATKKIAATFDEQCAHMFSHIKRIVEAGGGTVDNIAKITFWVNDRAQREGVNPYWVKMFPNEEARPARTTLNRDLGGGKLIECEIIAVI
jgi:enamine deaminase RidA (YjgF/YER057c/UK114 family)